MKTCVSKLQQLVDEFELASRSKIVRREPGRDGKILSDHRQDGNVEAHRLYTSRTRNGINFKVFIVYCENQRWNRSLWYSDASFTLRIL